MQRRDLLAALGSAATLGIAGCSTLGGTSGRSTTFGVSSTETTPGTSATPTGPPPTEPPSTGTVTVTDDLDSAHPVGTVVELPDGGRVGVESVRVRNAITYPGPWMERFSGGADRQFVVASVVREAGETPTPPDEDGSSPFALQVDGERYDPGISGGPPRIGFVGGGDPTVVFEVGTALDPASAAVVYATKGEVPDQRFELGAEHLRAIRLEPDFSVTDFRVSDAADPVGDDARVDVSFRVHNGGDRDGVFVGMLDLPPGGYVADYHPTRPVRIPVERDASSAWNGSPTWSMPPRDSGSVRLVWSGSTRSESVSFEDVDVEV